MTSEECIVLTGIESAAAICWVGSQVCLSATSCTELSLVKVHSRKSSTLESHAMKIRPLD